MVERTSLLAENILFDMSTRRCFYRLDIPVTWDDSLSMVEVFGMNLYRVVFNNDVVHYVLESSEQAALARLKVQSDFVKSISLVKE